MASVTPQLKVLLSFVGCWLIVSTVGEVLGQTSAPEVRYRFLEDPLEWKVLDKPLGLSPDDMAKLGGGSLRDQLQTLQRILDYSQKGLVIPEAFMLPIDQLVAGARSPELRRVLLGVCMRLERKQHAEAMLGWLDEDPVLLDHAGIELAAWGAEPLLVRWRARIGSNESAASMCRAVEGLGRYGGQDDLPMLRRLLETRPEAVLKIAVAEAIGRIQPNELEALARTYVEKVAMTEVEGTQASIALGLLAHHRSDEARQIMTELVEQAVPGVGARCLEGIPGEPPLELAERMLEHADPAMRLSALRVFARGHDARSFGKVSGRLSDPVVVVRREAARLLVEWGEKERELVLEVVMPWFDQENTLGLEQACLIVGTLKHAGATKKISRLVDHPSADVYVTAAWAIRRLASKESHAEQVMKKAVLVAVKMMSNLPKTLPTQDEFHRLAHLIETAGELRYAGASQDLMRLVPRGPVAVHTRCAAIWALGRIHEGDAEWEGRGALEDRMMDFEGASPEDPWVRYASAIALGRIGNVKSLEKMEKIVEPTYSSQYEGLEWARTRLRAVK